MLANVLRWSGGGNAHRDDATHRLGSACLEGQKEPQNWKQQQRFLQVRYSDRTWYILEALDESGPAGPFEDLDKCQDGKADIRALPLMIEVVVPLCIKPSKINIQTLHSYSNPFR